MTARHLSAALVLALALAGCGDDPTTPSASASSTPAPSPAVPSPPVLSPAPSAAPSPAPSADPTGAEGGVVLGGAELGVTRFGTSMDEAVRAVSAVLGEPDEDPAQAVSCIESEREVRWGELVLAGSDGLLAGWASRSRTLQTPSGVAVGTPLTSLQQVYGDALERFPANPDNGPTFGVQGVDVFGGLSSEAEDAVVTTLFSGFCAGP